MNKKNEKKLFILLIDDNQLENDHFQNYID